MIYSLRVLEREKSTLDKERTRILNSIKRISLLNNKAINELDNRIKDIDSVIELINKQL